MKGMVEFYFADAAKGGAGRPAASRRLKPPGLPYIIKPPLPRRICVVIIMEDVEYMINLSVQGACPCEMRDPMLSPRDEARETASTERFSRHGTILPEVNLFTAHTGNPATAGNRAVLLS
jgi:hypothetical protein